MAVTASPPAPTGHRSERDGRTIRWWYAAMVIELVHMPLVIAMVVAGAALWSGTVYATVVTVVVVLQIAVMGCPIMAVTGWMRRKHDAAYEQPWSFTLWLYRRHGPAAGIAVFLFFLTLALALRAALF